MAHTDSGEMMYSERREEYYCDDCYHEYAADVHQYDYQPEPVFHGTGTTRFYGVELEIDDGDASVTDDLKAISDDENLFYLKSDGSLGDSGVEIVTHPATLKFHEKQFPWQDVIDTAKQYGYTSHDAGSCGMHIHVSRDSLGKSRRAQDQTIDKLLVMIWRFWPQLRKFSRRGSDMQWCNPNIDSHHEGPFRKSELDYAKDKGKYSALNVYHGPTIEFRLFRGTLRRETLMASLQLFDVLIDLAMANGLSWAIRSAKWQDVIDAAEKRPALKSYLNSRFNTDAGTNELEAA
jgi:hypothetical protein